MTWTCDGHAIHPSTSTACGLQLWYRSQRSREHSGRDAGATEPQTWNNAITRIIHDIQNPPDTDTTFKPDILIN